MSTGLNLLFEPEHVVELVMRAYDGTEIPTLADVHQSVSAMLAGPLAGLRPQIDQIVNDVLKRLNVRIGVASVLDADAGHEPWIDTVDRSGWRLWPRYLGVLRDVERLPKSVLNEIDRSSDAALSRLERPDRPGRWDRRGLVVGHVQSGKTTNYTALAAKAIDAGYRIVIVLAGLHNSLRSQTHERIDRDLIGRDSTQLADDPRRVRRFGVTDYSFQRGLEDPPFTLLTCTNALEKGDFRKNVARQVWFQVNEGARLVMVVKKNAAILKSLHGWLTMLLGEGQGELIHQPTLIIDDEADQASINTRETSEDPSVINGWVRQLLMSFPRVGFAGYTATPFANIFIDPSANLSDSKYGPDLFPRSFIVNLKAADDYIGPDLVFGHPGDESVGLLERNPLPTYINVDDSAAWIGPKHKKSLVPGALPESLCAAIRLFVLNCAARVVRGDGKRHNSMLVHATRFTLVQNRIRQQVQEKLDTLSTLIESGSESVLAEQEEQFRRVWVRELEGNHAAFEARLGERCEPLPSWSKVWAQVPSAIQRIKVLSINGSSDDTLAYTRNEAGLWVVAIGGDKLSRGLTLHGLTVSYFLRTSSMFDTLMQMGRWFGYRPRYADLCRVYTTADLYKAFREISLAIDELRADLDRMALAKRTPEEFGLRVRTPTDSLLITAANKIRRGEPVGVRFEGTLVQALRVARGNEDAIQNRAALVQLVRSCGSPSRIVRNTATGWYVWRDQEITHVRTFLSAFTAFSSHCFLNQCDALLRYINEQHGKSELTSWTVCLVGRLRPDADTADPVEIGGLSVFPVRRKSEEYPPQGQFGTQSLAGKAEESVDLTESEFAAALEATKSRAPDSEMPVWPGRDDIREIRPPTRGLLLLYPVLCPGEAEGYVVSAAVSFPTSSTARALTYTVTPVWRQEHGLETDVDDEA